MRSSALTVLGLLAALATRPPAAEAQGVAVVTQCKGPVTVVEAVSRSPRTLAVLPDTGRVSGGTLASNDEVVTGSGASAEIRCADGSVFRLEPDSRLAIVESALTARRPGDKTVRRTLRLAAGRVACDVKPSESVYTSIRTEAGVVGVRGTTLTVSYGDARMQVTVGEGQVFVLDPAARIVFSLGNGQQMELRLEAPATLAKVTGAGGRAVSVSVGDLRLQMDDGDAIRVAPGADGALSVTVVSGPVLAGRGGAAAAEAQTGATLTAGGETPPAAAAEPAAARAAAAAPPDEVPLLPDVPAIRDTIEASPMN